MRLRAQPKQLPHAPNDVASALRSLTIDDLRFGGVYVSCQQGAVCVPTVSIVPFALTPGRSPPGLRPVRIGIRVPLRPGLGRTC